MSGRPPTTSAIAGRVAEVRQRIRLACERAGRDEREVTLVAASKTRSAEEVVAALEAGVTDFGENRPEDAVAKIEAAADLARQAGIATPRWHMIGHVQGRKAKLVVGAYSLIHSLDSLELAQRLDRLASAAGATVDALLEVNTSGEASKFGLRLALIGGQPDPSQLQDVESICSLASIRVLGLMTMAPISEEQEMARPYFTSLRHLRHVLSQRLPDCDWRHLSMGMTDDYEVAIAEGATLVRVGRAIFGERGPQ